MNSFRPFLFAAVGVVAFLPTACAQRQLNVSSRTVSVKQVAVGDSITPIRPPAVPLIVRDPYVSTWQPSNELTGTWASFWTGATKAMTGIARVDGHPFVFMGDPIVNGDAVAPNMTQTSLRVTPTQSVYTLEGGGVAVTLDFLSPVDPTDLERQSIPLGYIFASARSVDGQPHTVSLYFDISGEWANGDDTTPITWQEASDSDGTQALDAFTVQTAQPKVLSENHDYASWGNVVWATADQPNVTFQSGADTDIRPMAASQNNLGNTMDTNQPRAISDSWPVFGYDINFGTVGSQATKPSVLVLGNVRDPAVSYQGQQIPPLWKSYWPDWQHMLSFFYDDAANERQTADALDAKITAAATKAGGEHYAALCTIALRQAFGATELVGTSAQPWLYLKEISSDGNVSTVDVIYPSFPVLLYSNPYLLRLELDPLLAYAESGKWPQPFAPHDLGASYPNGSGHNDGGGENMPVEESANMLIMAAAYMRYAPHADAVAYATLHYKILKQWADYLLTVPSSAANGPDGQPMCNALDPQYQNQTDDFTGPIAHSSNLALKGILGVGAMGQIAKYAGNSGDAGFYNNAAKKMIGEWVTLSQNTSKTHLLITYRESGTGRDDTSAEPDDAWSLKYNAFPDKILGLNLIPQSVLNEEAKFYMTKMTPFGDPLDYRHTYTKDDWETWMAASTDDSALRQAIVDGIYNFANTSNARVPFSDWYDTATGQQKGFQARPVIGGIFAILDRTALTPGK